MGEMLAPKTLKTKLLFNLYSQSSSDGAQVFDGTGNEDALVFEPMLFVSHQIDETTNLSLYAAFDLWTAESDTILDGKTGQSGEGIGSQTRTSVNFSYAKEIGNTILTPKIGFSTEYDYRSFNAGLVWTGSFAEDNFTLTMAGQVFIDSAKQFDYVNELTTEFKDKRVYSFDTNVSQFLTRDDIVSGGVTVIFQEGSLESIRNTTLLNGSRVPESLPGSRKRYAYYTQWVHAFNDEVATSFKYRYYHDTWDLNANSLEASLRLSVQEEDGFLNFSYRLHDQSKTKYSTRELTTLQTHHTSDSDLEDFSSHRFGLHYSYELGEKKFMKFPIENVIISAGAYYYNRSNNLSYVTTQFGVGAEF